MSDKELVFPGFMCKHDLTATSAKFWNNTLLIVHHNTKWKDIEIDLNIFTLLSWYVIEVFPSL
jgi:hypothetical protein